MNRWVLVAAALLGAAVGVGACDPTEQDDFYVDVVDAGDEAFAHRAFSFLYGRSARSIHEVEALVSLIEATDRATVAQAMARSDEGRERWRATLLDLLAVSRLGHLSSRHCHGTLSEGTNREALATFVRDHEPREQPDDVGPWTLADLADGALLLDDVTPLFRAHLMSSFARQRPLQTLAEELSERQVTGEVFGKTFLGRQMECLPCHNGAFSVTGSDDPETDRTWELGGRHEAALFGADDGGDPALFWAYFRRYGVLAQYNHTSQMDWYEPPPDRGCWADEQPGCNRCACESDVLEQMPECGDAWTEDCVALCTDSGGCADPVLVQPWGISADDCGRFLNPDAFFDDLVFDEAFFIEPSGPRASVWDLEAQLHAGFEAVRGVGLVTDEELPDGPQAFAQLVAANLVDRVWGEAFGARLTLGHGFARNKHQRAVLADLTDGFLGSGLVWSELLMAVVEHPLFNAAPPALTEPTTSPYSLPPIFDPWSVERDAVDEQGNTFGDRVHRRDGRALVRDLYGAMGWPAQLEFHGGDEGEETGAARIQESMGVYLKEALPGFRGVATQSLLAWEATFGSCHDTVPRGWGCESNSEWGCPDCPCEAEVCADMPECCEPGRRWTPLCVARCAASEAGCRPPTEPPPDFIEQLVAAGRAEGATLGDAVASLKDRLLADPRLVDRNEIVVLSRVIEGDLEAPLGDDADDQLRRACAVFLATPQFLLAGDPGDDRVGARVPLPIGGTEADYCEALAGALFDGEVSCR